MVSHRIEKNPFVFLCFGAMSMAYRNSGAREWTHDTAVTRAIAVKCWILNPCTCTRKLPEWFFFFFNSHTCGILKKVPGPRIECKPQLQPRPQLQQCWILKPEHRAGDRTCTSTATRAVAVRFLTRCTRVGIPMILFLNHLFIFAIRNKNTTEH